MAYRLTRLCATRSRQLRCAEIVKALRTVANRSVTGCFGFGVRCVWLAGLGAMTGHAARGDLRRGGEKVALCGLRQDVCGGLVAVSLLSGCV